MDRMKMILVRGGSNRLGRRPENSALQIHRPGTQPRGPFGPLSSWRDRARHFAAQSLLEEVDCLANGSLFDRSPSTA